MVIMMQGLASSDATINGRIIVHKCTDTDSSYIEYPPLPHVLTVLESQGIRRGGRSLSFETTTLKENLGKEKNHLRVCGKLRS